MENGDRDAHVLWLEICPFILIQRGNRGASEQRAFWGWMIGPNRPKLNLIILVVFSSSSVFSSESRLILPSCAEQSVDMSAHVNPVNILTQLVIYLCVTFPRFNRRREIHTHAHVHASTWTDTVTGGVCILQYVRAVCVYFSVCVFMSLQECVHEYVCFSSQMFAVRWVSTFRTLWWCTHTHTHTSCFSLLLLFDVSTFLLSNIL